MIPSVLLRTSIPTKSLRRHCPSCNDWCACGTLRARASISAKACSAAAIVLPVGEFTTAIPWRVAASRSMLSTPTPARPITWRFLPASIISAVTCVSERTTSPS